MFIVKVLEKVLEEPQKASLSPQKKKAPKPHGFKAFRLVETAGLEPVTSTMRILIDPFHTAEYRTVQTHINPHSYAKKSSIIKNI